MPRGPEQATEDWFAGQRMSFSIYVAVCFDRDDITWHIYLSRVMEKSSAYAGQCHKYDLGKHDWEGIHALESFSDGPKQLKSLEYIAAASHDAMLNHHLKTNLSILGKRSTGRVFGTP